MGDCKHAYQIKTIRAQFDALEEKGFQCFGTFQQSAFETHAKVVIRKGLKAWHFCDPDLNVVISQICTLHQSFIDEENILRKFISLMEAKNG